MKKPDSIPNINFIDTTSKKVIYRFFYIKNGAGVFFMCITYVKCTDCGTLMQITGSLKEMGILDGNNCPNCGGEVVILSNGFM
jgi:DNA-directed RNA polymerase subunit RPC12/RpoP